jgi:hypothetical protein
MAICEAVRVPSFRAAGEGMHTPIYATTLFANAFDRLGRSQRCS